MSSLFNLIHTLPRDGLLLFATRATRMFAYGFLSVVLILYLKAEGLSEQQIGVLLTMTLLGDMVISLWITTAADRIGRKWMLILGAGLMSLVGCAFALTGNFVALLVVATIGVLSPSDKEVGPFLSIEQAVLSQTISDDQRTAVFAWYNLVGSLTAALGRLRAASPPTTFCASESPAPPFIDRLSSPTAWSGSRWHSVSRAERRRRIAAPSRHPRAINVVGTTPLARRYSSPVSLICTRRLRRRLYPPEHRCLLVLSPISS